MQTFVELLKESVLVQGSIALVTIGAIVYLAVTGQPVPDVLSGIAYAVIGFYFGQKVQLQRRRQQEEG